MGSGLDAVRTMHPALEQALDAFPTELSSSAAAALQSLLRERITADGEQAWSSSRLTGDGYPVEITFTTADDRLRYTVEPGSDRLAPRQRLDEAVRLVNALSPVPLPEGAASAFRSMQKAGSLSFGAWIGGRHGPGDNQYKIYVEMPGEDSAGEIPAPAPAAGLAKRLQGKQSENPKPWLSTHLPAASLRMAAYSPASGQWELYYRVKSLAPYHVPGALAPAGLAAKSEELLRYIRDTYGYSLGERLPGESVGISYSFHAGQDPQSVTLFFFARALWGGDARIRQRFGRLAAALGWDDSRYQAVTEPLSARRTWKTYHGIVGITLARGGQMALSIGVRPVTGDQEDTQEGTP